MSCRKGGMWLIMTWVYNFYKCPKIKALCGMHFLAVSRLVMSIVSALNYRCVKDNINFYSKKNGGT